MTEVYSAETNTVVANGDAWSKVGLHIEVPNCLPLNGPQVNARYSLRDGHRFVAVKCLTQGAPGIQTATFQEV